jgi:hypothetical protein
MRDAAAEADRIIRSLEGKTGSAAQIRSAQLALAKVQVQAWGSIKDAVTVGIGDAVDAASDLQAAFDEAMFRRVGLSPSYWRQSLLAQSRQGIESFTSRKQFDYTLSQKVYRNQAISQGFVDREINNGLLLGKSAREIASSVKRFISPSTPGGASYAAMRLGRTEVANAFHTTNINNYKATPWVEKVKWHLSGSHPRPDACNEYAEQGSARGAGIWYVDDVPAKPHPNCLCFTEPVDIGLDAYVKNFKAGKYDDYINDQLGCRVA